MQRLIAFIEVAKLLCGGRKLAEHFILVISEFLLGRIQRIFQLTDPGFLGVTQRQKITQSHPDQHTDYCNPNDPLNHHKTSTVHQIATMILRCIAAQHLHFGFFDGIS